MNPNQFIVRLGAGVWLSVGDGDPAHTLVEAHAVRFDAHWQARNALVEAREFRPFLFASIRTVAGIPVSQSESR